MRHGIGRRWCEILIATYCHVNGLEVQRRSIGNVHASATIEMMIGWKLYCGIQVWARLQPLIAFDLGRKAQAGSTPAEASSHEVAPNLRVWCYRSRVSYHQHRCAICMALYVRSDPYETTRLSPKTAWRVCILDHLLHMASHATKVVASVGHARGAWAGSQFSEGSVWRCPGCTEQSGRSSSFHLLFLLLRLQCDTAPACSEPSLHTKDTPEAHFGDRFDVCHGLFLQCSDDYQLGGLVSGRVYLR